jgi:hypothetical protein
MMTDLGKLLHQNFRRLTDAGCLHLNVETGEQGADRIRAYPWPAPEQTIIPSSCSFNHLPRDITFGKLQAMQRAKAILNERTG